MYNLAQWTSSTNGAHGARYAAVLPVLAILYFSYCALRRSWMIVKISGPPSSSWLFGHMRELILTPTYGEYEFEWLRKYGAVYRIKACFGETRIMVSDPAAMQFILMSGHFGTGPTLENGARLLYADGSVFRAKEEEHKRLRAVLNAGFSAGAVRKYLPIFERAAHSLTEHFEHLSGELIDVVPPFGRATLGTTSEAILGCSVDDLGDDFITNNLQLLSLASSQSPSGIIFDGLSRWIPPSIYETAIYLPVAPFTILRRAKNLAYELGKTVVEDIINAMRQKLENTGGFYGELGEYEHDRTLNKRGIIAQTSLILFAGQDTTANTLAFGLVELAQNPGLQEKLRIEIHDAMSNSSARDIAYENMPQLNAFIKEVLRMYPAEVFSDRVALQDTVLPLSDPIRTADGKQISQLPVPKGQILMFAIASYQRLQSRWGEDADTFRPSRWLEGGGILKGEAMGPYANLLTFLGGAHTCLGWRFALLELQVFICELVGNFEFSLPPQGPARCCYGGTLLPALPDGKKGAVLRVERVM
ncbi:cytochrome P450 [Favolaschia claudopus]|uniref:Cytochrome P450 n=1 Tax=Favolaschia claudopus TaxID=2862362 RepID=A0AAV9ZGE0_9AGAR